MANQLIDLQIDHEQLKQRIKNFGREANDAHQIAKRLADALRCLTSKDPTEFEKLISELIKVRTQARWARIQYETHLMLFDARLSLQAAKRRRLR